MCLSAIYENISSSTAIQTRWDFLQVWIPVLLYNVMSLFKDNNRRFVVYWREY